MGDTLGLYRLSSISTDQQVAIGDHRLSIVSVGSSLSYKRYVGSDLKAQSMIMSDEESMIIGIFPSPPLLTPLPVSDKMYLKFASPVVVEQRSEAVVYSKIPIEIGVYRQSKDEELLIDAFSLGHQKYALYGPPESGVVCRYAEEQVSADKNQVKPEKYQEALVRIRIRNGIDNVVKVTKVIIPLKNVILDHSHDESWLPGSVQMTLDTAFGRDFVNVQL
ncbi:MAG: DUF432 domain-containing protein, partial [Nitrososphaera sp.]|nr:DUF432 domain-containing protein [Nitrososphaera sp.]